MIILYCELIPLSMLFLEKTDSEGQLEMLLGMINGRRLRDISDLPFDLAI
jgi:hypothetical protein